MKTVTFKNHIPTGRYRSFERRQSDIKHEGKAIGCIAESQGGDYRIWLHKKEESASGFKNVRLNGAFSSMPEAKKAFKSAWDAGKITTPVFHLE